MSKQILTPMRKLKDHFEVFSKNINHLNIQKTELQYSKESHSYYGGDKKGVESDFLRIFTISPKVSFSFKFTFLAEDKKTVIDNQFIELIFKEDELFTNSKMYTLSEMRDLLKSINCILKTRGSFDEFELFDFLKDTCAMKESEIDIKAKEFIESFELNSADQQMMLDAELTYIYNLKTAINTGETTLTNYVTTLPESKELRELEIKVQKLRNTINKKTEDKRIQLQIDENKKALYDAKRKTARIYQRVMEIATDTNVVMRLPRRKIESLTLPIKEKVQKLVNII